MNFDEMPKGYHFVQAGSHAVINIYQVASASWQETDHQTLKVRTTDGKEITLKGDAAKNVWSVLINE